MVKAKQAAYVKDDFFDMMSCETLDKMGHAQGDGPHHRRSVQVRKGQAGRLAGVLACLKPSGRCIHMVEPRSRGKHGRCRHCWTGVSDGCVAPLLPACCCSVLWTSRHLGAWVACATSTTGAGAAGAAAAAATAGRVVAASTTTRRAAGAPASEQQQQRRLLEQAGVCVCAAVWEGMSRACAVLSGSTTGALSAGSSSSSSILGC